MEDTKIWRREIVIGDVHGCYDELMELMDILKVDKEYDKVIFLGDLIDRGPKGPDVVDFVMNNGYLCVMGNHEYKHIKTRRKIREGKDKKADGVPKFGEDLLKEHLRYSDEQITWMNNLPICLVLDNQWVAVHGGFSGRHLIKEDIGNDEQVVSLNPTMSCLFTRYVNEDGKDLPISASNNYAQPPGSYHWAEIWAGVSVIYGHSIYSFFVPRVCNNTIGIDTGCCFGGKLTAAVFNHGKDWPIFFQVQAKHQYGFYSGTLSTKE